MKILYKYKLLFAFSLLGTPGCECKGSETSAHAFPARESPVLYASGEVELDDVRSFFKQVFGNSDYITDFQDISKYPLGSVEEIRVPYYDSWYPEALQGANQAGSLQKYDQAFYGGESKAAKWELENHSQTSPAWYGHCNGTSVSGARYQSPRLAVKRPHGCTLGT